MISPLGLIIWFTTAVLTLTLCSFSQATAEDMTAILNTRIPQKVKDCELGRKNSYQQETAGLYSKVTNTGIYIKKTPDLPNVKIATNCSQELECELKGCNKGCPVIIRWIKEGSSEIIHMGNKLEMEYTTYIDVGRYHCFAEYEKKEYYGSFNMIIDAMYVMKDPDEYYVIVERGKDQTLWCELNRTRTEPIRWEKEGSNLELPEGNTFDLINATYDEAGIYHCRGWYNRWYNASFNVQIQGRPCGVPKIIPQNPVVRISETFTLTCNASGIDRGIPVSTDYIWTKDGEEINGENDEVLRYKPIQAGACQEYGCVIKNKYGSSQTGRTMLRVEGSPSIPLDLNVTHKTSKSLDISWKILVKICYELEFEVQVLKDSKLTKEIIFKDCREEHCKLRITELQPQSEYILEMRSRVTGADDQWLYSDYVTKKETTLARPAFNPMPPKVTETTMVVSWKYGRKGDEYCDTTEQVTVAIQYKKTGALNFTRYPEDRNIPAENKIAQIDGSFDTSAIYLIVYEVYEGDQLTMETTPNEISPPETNSRPAFNPMPPKVTETTMQPLWSLSSCPSLGQYTIIGVGIFSFLVGVWFQKGKQQKHESGLQPSNTGYEGSDYENIGSNGNNRSEYTELHDLPVPTDVSGNDVPPELAPLPPNNDKVTRAGSAGAQYLDLGVTSDLKVKHHRNQHTNQVPSPPVKEGGVYEHAYDHIL